MENVEHNPVARPTFAGLRDAFAAIGRTLGPLLAVSTPVAAIFAVSVLLSSRIDLSDAPAVEESSLNEPEALSNAQAESVAALLAGDLPMKP